MGIPVEYLPITMDGVLHNENHRKWLQFRIYQEQAQGHLPPSQMYIAASGIHRVEEDNDEDMEET
jgi:hypothetical protein